MKVWWQVLIFVLVRQFEYHVLQVCIDELLGFQLWHSFQRSMSFDPCSFLQQHTKVSAGVRGDIFIDEADTCRPYNLLPGPSLSTFWQYNVSYTLLCILCATVLTMIHYIYQRRKTSVNVQNKCMHSIIRFNNALIHTKSSFSKEADSQHLRLVHQRFLIECPSPI